MKQKFKPTSFSFIAQLKHSAVRIFSLESLKKLTALLLAFLFVISPVASAFAETVPDNSSGSSSSSSMPAVTSAPSQPAASSSIFGSSSGSSNNSTSLDAVASPSTSDNAASNQTTSSKTLEQTTQTPNSKTGQNATTNNLSPAHNVTPEDEGSSDIPTPLLPDNVTNLPNADKTNGSLNYSYPIQIPPGRNHFQPDLKLSYNSQEKAQNSAFGYGWQISIPYIELVNKVGSNTLYATSSSSTPYFTSSLWGDIVPSSTSSTSTYVSKVDTGDFIKYAFNSNQWTATDKQGDQYQFGYDASARQDNASSTSQVFKWMLEKEVDSNNNTITYSYYKDSGQIYPSTINYGGNATSTGIFTITFSRASTTDVSTTYDTAFPVTTNYRISEIQAAINSNNVGEWDLAYTTGDNGYRSILQGITQKGIDGGGTVTTLPQIKFTNQKISNLNQSSSSLSLPSDVDPEFTDFADVNGDGLTDIIISYTITTTGHTVQETYLNNGAGGWTLSSAYAPPEVWGTEGSIPADTDRTHYYIDVNGDGLPDIVSLDYDYTDLGSGRVYYQYKVYLNTGDGWSASSAWNVPYLVWSTNGQSSDPAFMDVNGDGLPDLATGSIVYLNTGSGWSASSTPWSWPADPAHSTAQDKFADVNGDGIMDVLIGDWSDYTSGGSGHSTSTFQAWLGDGNGNFVQNSGYTPPTIFEYDHSNTGSCDCNEDTGVKVYDYNGDGLPDLVQSTNETTINTSSPNTDYTVQRVYLNTGTGWATSTSVSMNTYFSHGGDSYQGDYGLGDFNGDGITDTYDFNSGTVGELTSYSAPADAINGITYPSGGDTTIQYKPSPQYLSSGSLLNPSLPEALQTVSQISTGDGLGNSTTTDSYVYSGGTFYYSSSTPLDRKLAGFNKISDTNAAGDVTNTYYHTGNGTDSSHGEYQDNYLKIGEPYRIEQYDNSNNLYQKTINQWGSATSTAATASSTAGFVFLNQTVVSDYSGGSSHKDKAEAYSYSTTTGNTLQKIEYGQVTGSDNGTFTDTGTDDFTTNISYASTSTSTILSLPSDVTVTNHSASKVKEAQYYYDSQPLGVMGSNGNLTKELDWKTGSSYATSTQKTYNSYGLVTQSKDGDNNATNYSYDSYNLYPATTTNALSQVSEYTYDYLNGKTASTTDPNGNIFSNTYDGLGRPLLVQQPDPSATSTLDTKIAYTYTDTSGAVNVQEADSLTASSTVNSYTYFDGLDRKIQDRAEATSTNYTVKDYAYNNEGLLQKESLPYFNSGSSKTTATTTTALYTSYLYDPLQRVATTTNAIGTSTNAHSPWENTATDLNGNTKNYYYDAYNNLIQVDEHPVNASTTSELYYSPLYTDANLTHYWRYEGNSNDSKGSLNGTDNSVSYSTSYGKFGEGAGYNGTSSYTQTGSEAMTNAMTWTFWIDQTSTAPTYQVALYQGDSTSAYSKYVRVDSAGTITFVSNSAPSVTKTWTTNLTITENTPTMVTVTQGTTFSDVNIYINGVQATLTVSGTNTSFPSGTYDYTFGAAYGGMTGTWYEGGIDDLGVFSRELSSTEVLDLYNGVSVVSATTASTYYTYDYLGDLTNITDASGNVRNFTYDGLGNRLSAQDLHSSGDSTYGTWNYTYDNANNLTQTQDPNSNTINYGYDALNRKSSESLGSTLKVAYTYDTCANGIGRLCEASSSADTLLYAYDPMGRIAVSTSTINSIAYPTSFTYDRQGNQITITNPDSSKVQYLYNNAGQVDEVQKKETSDSGFVDVVSSIIYGPTGQETVISYPDGAVTTNTYDAAHLYRLTSKVTIAPEPFEDDEMMMMAPGNHKSSIHLHKPTPATIYIIESPQAATSTATSTLANLDLSPTSTPIQISPSTTPITDNSASSTPTDASSTPMTNTPDASSTPVNASSTPMDSPAASSTPDDATSTASSTVINLSPTSTPIQVLPSTTTPTTDGSASSTPTITATGTPLSLNENIGSWFASIYHALIGKLFGATNFLLAQFEPQTAYAAAIELYSTPLYTDANLTHYWRYEGNSNDSKGSLNGTDNSVSYSTSYGKFGEGAGYNGTSSYTQTGSEAMTNAMTWTFWIDQTSTAPTYQVALYQGDSTSAYSKYVRVDSAGTITFVSNSAPSVTKTWTTNLTITENTPTMVTVTQGTTFSDVNIYINGVQATLTVSGTNTSFPSGTYDYTFGAAYGGMTGTWYEGGIDDLGVFSRELSSTEVSDLYSGDWSGTEDEAIQDLNYTYDNNGNITQIVDSSVTDSAKTVTYTYDSLNRLTSASTTDVTAGQTGYDQTYTYDPLGNILSKSDVGSYTYATDTAAYLDPDAVASIGSTDYTYDDNGNLTAIGVGTSTPSSTYTWDYNNRMTQSVASSTTTTYAYDYTGQRVKTYDGTTTTVYPSQYYYTNGTTPTKQIYANGQLVATITGTGASSTVYTIINDQLTGSQLGLDGSSTIQQLLDYMPYGSTRLDEQAGSFDEQKKFDSMQADNTGLYYDNARYQNPLQGQFTSEDPVFLAMGDPSEIEQLTKQQLQQLLADPQALNAYSYARNNPIIYLDPTGQDFASFLQNSSLYNPLNVIFGPDTDAYSNALATGNVKQAGEALGNIALNTALVIESGFAASTIIAAPVLAEQYNAALQQETENESALGSDSGMTTVGRWMSQAEYEAMVKSGAVQEGGGGVTYVSTNGSEVYGKQASSGSVYVEFDVPSNSVQITDSSNGTGRIVGPNASQSAINGATKSGVQIGFPQATNIKIVNNK